MWVSETTLNVKSDINGNSSEICFYVCVCMMLTQTTPVRSKWGGGTASVCHSDLTDEVIKGAWPLSHDNMGLRLDRCVAHSPVCAAMTAKEVEDARMTEMKRRRERWGRRGNVRGETKEGEDGEWVEGRTSAWTVLTCLHLCVAEKDRRVRGVLELPVIALTLPFLVLHFDVPFSSCKLLSSLFIPVLL